MVFLRKPTPFEAAARPDTPQADLSVIGGPGDAVHRGPEGTVAVTLHNTSPDSDAVCPPFTRWWCACRGCRAATAPETNLTRCCT